MQNKHQLLADAMSLGIWHSNVKIDEQDHDRELWYIQQDDELPDIDKVREAFERNGYELLDYQEQVPRMLYCNGKLLKVSYRSKSDAK